MDLASKNPPARRLRRGDQVKATIEGLTHEGRGVARVNGKVLFVADALAGETALATVVKIRRSHDDARADEIENPSAQRVSPKCEWFGNCGGCSLQHLDAAAQLAAKQDWLLETLQRIGRVEPASVLPSITGPVWGYRRKGRLGVKHVDRKGRVLVGFRERYKPFITDMQGCEVLDPRLARLIVPLQEMIGELTVCRRLPQIEVAAGDDSVVLVMRVLDEPAEEDLVLFRAFEQTHGLTICLQRGGPDTVRRLDNSAAPALKQELPEFDVTMSFLPTDFVQVNAEINRKMISQVVEKLAPTKEDTVLDLYCGLGNFSLPLARKAGHVVGVEGAEALVSRARDNARENNIGNTEFFAADLDAEPVAPVVLQRKYDLLLLDPPRTGAAAICAIAGKLGVRRIAYVSCHPATLARDTEILTRNNDFVLQAAGVMDMFPHTAHVESLAIFERN
ncbi:MAG: 23S rRNA (uracil(1939)-C(5))-methyltransferase RlmD [Gammaproteobacteria bacterium]|nr:23S rRNA (uracil(1939)-C(5))-methyltransferase RlmD [Gammaproteobacteria bacterium]